MCRLSMAANPENSKAEMNNMSTVEPIKMKKKKKSIRSMLQKKDSRTQNQHSSHHDDGTTTTADIDADISNHSKANLNSSPPPGSVQVAVRIRPILAHDRSSDNCMYVSSSTTLNNNKKPSWGSLESSSSDTYSTARTEPLSQSTTATSITAQSTSYQNRTIKVTSSSFFSSSTPSSDATFTFDHVFDPSTTQSDLYSHCVSPLVTSCLEGYNATVLAYGQTGSGKTFTMMGDLGKETPTNNKQMLEDSREGIIPRAIRGMFHGLEEMKLDSLKYIHQDSQQQQEEQQQQHKSENGNHLAVLKSPYEYKVEVQFLELYGEEIRDLLNNGDSSNTDSDQQQLLRSRSRSYGSLSSAITSGPGLHIRDGKADTDAEVIGLRKVGVHSVEEALQQLEYGIMNRITCETGVHDSSSRSHAIFSIVIQQITRSNMEVEGDTEGNDNLENQVVEMKTSKFHFVDLAGSERIKKSHLDGDRYKNIMKEGVNINKGLLALGNVISALGSTKNQQIKKHVPYRDSKLTRLLKGSLGGNHKTTMIACVSPSTKSQMESINTLRYANRAKNIQNHAKVNVDPAHQVVNELKKQVSILAAELLRLRHLNDDETINTLNEVFPYSDEFLEGLMHSSENPAWRPKVPYIASTIPSDQERKEKDTNEDERPKSLASNGFFDLHNTQLSSNPATDSLPVLDKSTTYTTNPNSSQIRLKRLSSADTAHRKLASYDFALVTLREAVQAASAKKNKSAPSSPNLHEIRKMKGLHSIRDINDLHLYLKDGLKSDLASGVDENDVDITSHLTKIEECITHNENLIQEMIITDEQFKDMRKDSEDDIHRIENKLMTHQIELDELNKTINSFEKGSEFHDRLLKSIENKTNLINKLENKRSLYYKQNSELSMALNKMADENAAEMKRIEKENVILKRHRNEFKQLENDIDSTQILPDSSKASRLFPRLQSPHSHTSNQRRLSIPEPPFEKTVFRTNDNVHSEIIPKRINSSGSITKKQISSPSRPQSSRSYMSNDRGSSSKKFAFDHSGSRFGNNIDEESLRKESQHSRSFSRTRMYSDNNNPLFAIDDEYISNNPSIIATSFGFDDSSHKFNNYDADSQSQHLVEYQIDDLTSYIPSSSHHPEFGTSTEKSVGDYTLHNLNTINDDIGYLKEKLLTAEKQWLEEKLSLLRIIERREHDLQSLRNSIDRMDGTPYGVFSPNNDEENGPELILHEDFSAKIPSININEIYFEGLRNESSVSRRNCLGTISEGESTISKDGGGKEKYWCWPFFNNKESDASKVNNQAGIMNTRKPRESQVNQDTEEDKICSFPAIANFFKNIFVINRQRDAVSWQW